MTTGHVRFAAARAGGLGLLGTAVFLAACEATLPTATDIQRMNVASLEAAAGQAALIPSGGENTVYSVDGIQVSVEEARALAPEAIASVAVVRGVGSTEPSRVAIVTMEGERNGVTLPGSPGVVLGNEGSVVLSTRGIPLTNGAQPLIIVDGEIRAQTFRINDIPPGEIEVISVLKDVSATAVYGERGRNGVVAITTRRSTGNVEREISSSRTDSVRTATAILAPAGANATAVLRTDSGEPLTLTVERRPLHVIDASELATNGPSHVRIIDASGGPQPLYVVDGVVRESFSLSEIPADEIESISVLKDRSATEEYGPRGANGVVQITTRRGARSGETSGQER